MEGTPVRVVYLGNDRGIFVSDGRGLGGEIWNVMTR